MTRSFALIECTGDLWLGVADRLETDHGWRCAYWSGSDGMRAAVAGRHPRALFQENTSAVLGRYAPGIDPADFPPLDAEILDGLARSQPIACDMMDRMDADGSFTQRGRQALYHRHVGHALHLIERFPDAAFVFSATPHLVYDYVLYEACRRRGATTIVFTETAMDGLVFASPGHEEAPAVVGKVYEALLREGREARLSPRADAYWAKLQDRYENAVPTYISAIYAYQPEGRAPEDYEAAVLRDAEAFARQRFLEPAGNGAADGVPEPDGDAPADRGEEAAPGTPPPIRPAGRDALDDAAARIRGIAAMLERTGRTDPRVLDDALLLTQHIYRVIETQYPLHFNPKGDAYRVYLKQFGIAPEHSSLTFVEYWLYRLFAAFKKQQLLAEYRREETPVPEGTNYVYLAMHYQPEVSTVPLGSHFGDQRLVVDLLSKTLPEGWLLVLKEHRFTFDTKGSGELSRDVGVYADLARLPNVRFAPLDTDPFALMEGARAVATVTGTSGWEALSRGRPVLAFGKAWYLPCRGAYEIRTVEDCRRALAAIAAGRRPDVAEVRLFLEALETVGFRGHTIPDLAGQSGKEETENVAGFVDAIVREATKRTQAIQAAAPDALRDARGLLRRLSGFRPRSRAAP